MVETETSKPASSAMFHRVQGAFKGPAPPECVMGRFKAVYAHLDLFDLERFHVFLFEEHPVREQDLPEKEIRQHLVDLVEPAVEQRLAAGNQHAQTLHLLEFASGPFPPGPARQFIAAGPSPI